MNASSLSAKGRWLYAVKPASWPKVLVPALLGQALGYAGTGRVSALGLAVGLGFTVLDIVFIVLLNDWGDAPVDAGKRRMFPHAGSPKTIPDGILPARALLGAGVLAGACALLVAFVGERLLARPALTVSAVVCLLFFVAYTLPPLRLNYRGGGELLEGLGVGALLPWWNAYAQGGEALAPELSFLAGFVLWAQASAIASGLSDEESDRAGGKRTIATALGNPFARRASEALLFAGALVLLATPWVSRAVGAPSGPAVWVPVWVPIPAAAVAVYHGRKLVLASPAAVTNAFAAQNVYKMHLHHAIWRGGLALAAALVIARRLSHGEWHG